MSLAKSVRTTVSRPAVALSEARLEALAERFRARQVREFTGTTFEQYICDPDHWDGIMARIYTGTHGVRRDPQTGLIWLVRLGGTDRPTGQGARRVRGAKR